MTAVEVPVEIPTEIVIPDTGPDVLDLTTETTDALFAQVRGISTMDDINTALSDMSAQVVKAQTEGRVSEPVATGEVKVIDGVRESLHLGELRPDEVPAFFRWVKDYAGYPTVPLQPAPDLWVSTMAIRYNHGDNPESLAHRRKTEKTGTPAATPAQHAVAAEARKVHPQHVNAPGLTVAEANAISKAVGAAYTDALRVQAAVIGSYLGPYTPGEVPQALHDLDRAVGALERQMTRVRNELAGRASVTLGAHVAAHSEALGNLRGDVAHLQAQMGEHAHSGLESGITANTDALKALEVAGTAGLAGLEARVVVHGKMLAGQEISGLSEEVKHAESLAREAEAQAQAALQKVGGVDKTCLDTLCEDQAQVINPIKEGKATVSDLRHLGGLLRRAFEIGFLATFAQVVLAILDAPLAVEGVLSDTEHLTTWAEGAAGTVEQHLSSLAWMGRG